MHLKVHKNENFFGCDCEYCTVSLLVVFIYQDFVKKSLIVPLMGEIRTRREIVQNPKSEPKKLSFLCTFNKNMRILSILILLIISVRELGLWS
jgi:hypothetical protein